MQLPVALVLVALLWWCFYYIVRLGSLDPHNVGATPNAWVSVTQATVALLALLAIPAVQATNPDWVSFLAMFVLAQTVAVAFTSPDRYRANEMPGRIRRLLEEFKSKIAGAVLAKVLSIVLAFLTGWLIGDYWFALLVIVGFALIRGKGVTALGVIPAEDGEFAQLSESERGMKVAEWAPLVRRGSVAYFVGCSMLGVALYQHAGLHPMNWMGWAGLLGGATVSAVLSSVAQSGSGIGTGQ